MLPIKQRISFSIVLAAVIVNPQKGRERKSAR